MTLLAKQTGLSLIDHALDVGFTFRAISNSPLYKGRFSSITKLDEPGLRVFLGRLFFLSLIHDLGKATKGFQAKIRGKPGHNHLVSAATLLGKDSRILLESFPFLEDWDRDFPLRNFLEASFSHHGAGSLSQHSPSARRAPRTLWGPEIREFALQTIEVTEHHAPEAMSPMPRIPDDPGPVHLFLGLLIMSDWIASDERLFGAVRPEDLEAKTEYSRRNAVEVVKKLKLHPERVPLATSSDAFGVASTPLQETVDALPLSEKSLVIIEGGTDRIEAAFRYFQRLFSEGFVDGCYLAVGSSLAAKVVYEKIAELSSRSVRLPLVQAVQGEWKPGGKSSIQASTPEMSIPESLSEEIFSEAFWSAEAPSRCLCSPLAVGTADQVLLSALRVKGAHFRMAALARSLLVLDDVHRSDEYESTVIREIVRRASSMGGHVLLLSSVLGQSDRDLYLDAFGGPPSSFSASEAVTTSDGTRTETFLLRPTPPRKAARMETRVLDDPEDFDDTARFIEALPGRRILVSRNSLKTALKTQEALATLGVPLIEVRGGTTLHHDGYSCEDRRLLNGKILEKFGIGRHPGDRTIVVSAGGLSRSCGVEFDVVVTDPVPAGILLDYSEMMSSDEGHPGSLIVLSSAVSGERPVKEDLLSLRDNAEAWDRLLRWDASLAESGCLGVPVRPGLNEWILRLDHPVESPFGEFFDELVIPGWMFGATVPDLRSKMTAIPMSRGIALRQGEHSFFYDRWGLRPTRFFRDPREGR